MRHLACFLALVAGAGLVYKKKLRPTRYASIAKRLYFVGKSPLQQQKKSPMEAAFLMPLVTGMRRTL